MSLRHMPLATDGCRSPWAQQRLIVFAGDTAAADEVKYKPSVRNCSSASLAEKWASKCTGTFSPHMNRCLTC